jgi:hypothetical protein
MDLMAEEFFLGIVNALGPMGVPISMMVIIVLWVAFFTVIIHGPYSIVRPFVIRRIERRLTSEDANFRIENLFEDRFGKSRDESKRALISALDLSEKIWSVRRVMRKYKIERGDLDEMYSFLMRCGAGQIVNGRNVAIRSICYSKTIEFYCNAKASKEINWEDSMELAWRLLTYWKQPWANANLISTTAWNNRC